MIIHSIISSDDIFYTDNSLPITTNGLGNGSYFETVKYGNRDVVNRLFTTDPKMYLYKRYLPGATGFIQDSSSFQSPLR